MQEELLLEAAPGIEATDAALDQSRTAGDVAEAAPGAEAAAGKAASNGTRGAEPGFRLQSAMPAAWLQAALDRMAKRTDRKGWAVLEMKLNEGDGTVTVKAQRTKDRVAVSVAFSDSSLRALASAHAERIQEALQMEFGSAVDLSLSGEGAGEQHERHTFRKAQDHPGRPASLRPGVTEVAEAGETVAVRTLAPDVHHEWIG